LLRTLLERSARCQGQRSWRPHKQEAVCGRFSTRTTGHGCARTLRLIPISIPWPASGTRHLPPRPNGSGQTSTRPAAYAAAHSHSALPLQAEKTRCRAMPRPPCRATRRGKTAASFVLSHRQSRSGDPQHVQPAHILQIAQPREPAGDSEPEGPRVSSSRTCPWPWLKISHPTHPHAPRIAPRSEAPQTHADPQPVRHSSLIMKLSRARLYVRSHKSGQPGKILQDTP